MNILEEIVAYKRDEVRLRREKTPTRTLEASSFFTRNVLSLKAALADTTKTGIIAEFKRRSPSKGVINDTATVSDVVKAYYENGASGISVLTDEKYFGGTAADLQTARQYPVPILRKDFIVDEYQLIEARSIGADVILLIAACLSVEDVKRLSGVAHGLGLEVLLEIHDDTELDHICDTVDMVGVNNRNLKTFEVNINTSLELIGKLPKDKPAISESGISGVETIFTLADAGFKGFLVGENFMRQPDPAMAFAGFVKNLKAGA